MIHKMGHNAWTYREGKTRNMYVVEYSKKVMSNTVIETEQQKIEYIRGYFDAEGSTSRLENVRFYIYFAQKNKSDLEQLKSYLTELGIICGKTHNPSKLKDPNYWRFFISCKSYKLFIQKNRIYASNKKSALKEEDIVHALWRHKDKREQGIRRGTCGWITSYDKKKRSGRQNTKNIRR